MRRPVADRGATCMSWWEVVAHATPPTGDSQPESSVATPRARHRRVIDIWPLANAPEQEFEPPYVPVIVIVVRFTCAIPVALDEHPADIMLLVGMSIVNVMSSPDIVPWKEPGIRPCMPEPEKLMEPVTVDPFCVSCQVIVPMSV